MKKLSRNEMKSVMGGKPFINGCGGPCIYGNPSGQIFTGRCYGDNFGSGVKCYCSGTNGAVQCILNLPAEEC